MKKEHSAAESSANPWMFVSLFLGALLVASFVTNIYFLDKVTSGVGAAAPSAPSAPSAPGAPSAPAAPSAPVKVDATGPSMGKDNAPVTIIEFSDFQCPFCKRFNDQTMGQLKTNYIDTGKARIVFRHYPLPFHQNAPKAHEASMCADDQDKFWEFHDILFAKGAGDGTGLAVADLKQYAADLKLDTTKFNSCLDSGKYTKYVADDMAAGSAAGVSGTPSFVINGQLVVGAQPYSVFAAAIDAALAK